MSGAIISVLVTEEAWLTSNSSTFKSILSSAYPVSLVFYLRRFASGDSIVSESISELSESVGIFIITSPGWVNSAVVVLVGLPLRRFWPSGITILFCERESV